MERHNTLRREVSESEEQGLDNLSHPKLHSCGLSRPNEWSNGSYIENTILDDRSCDIAEAFEPILKTSKAFCDIEETIHFARDIRKIPAVWMGSQLSHSQAIWQNWYKDVALAMRMKRQHQKNIKSNRKKPFAFVLPLSVKGDVLAINWQEKGKTSSKPNPSS